MKCDSSHAGWRACCSFNLSPSLGGEMVCLSPPSSASSENRCFVISHLINCVTALILPAVCFGNDCKNCSAPSPKKKKKNWAVGMFNFCLQSECLFRAHLVKSFINVMLRVCWIKSKIKPELNRIQVNGTMCHWLYLSLEYAESSFEEQSKIYNGAYF